jgi:hypothetical protein
MFEALKFFDKRVNLDELFQRPAWTSEPVIETFIVRKVVQHSMVFALQKLVDYPGM